jgi:hypothetical protein
LRKPSLGFAQKADVSLILFARKERYDPELRLAVIGVQG